MFVCVRDDAQRNRDESLSSLSSFESVSDGTVGVGALGPRQPKPVRRTKFGPNVRACRHTRRDSATAKADDNFTCDTKMPQHAPQSSSSCGRIYNQNSSTRGSFVCRVCVFVDCEIATDNTDTACNRIKEPRVEPLGTMIQQRTAYTVAEMMAHIH